MSQEILHNEDLPVVEALHSAPVGRHAQPEELANVALFPVSDETSFVQGRGLRCGRQLDHPLTSSHRWKKGSDRIAVRALSSALVASCGR
ncbi:hypothetical protein ACWPOB_00545 [Rhodococcus sp. 2H158]